MAHIYLCISLASVIRSPANLEPKICRLRSVFSEKTERDFFRCGA
ncbi:hypothetical protein HMPREF1554_01376 [Porphyromonas gingivalis F0569]|nr:hypothetical protein HMPREF1554_01376 [Porphyromonas gingivalis F0569]